MAENYENEVTEVEVVDEVINDDEFDNVGYVDEYDDEEVEGFKPGKTMAFLGFGALLGVAGKFVYDKTKSRVKNWNENRKLKKEICKEAKARIEANKEEEN